MDGTGLKRTVGTIVALTVLGLATPGIARAASVTVTTTADNVNAGACTPKACTLRQALQFTSDPQNGTFVNVPAGRYVLNPQFGPIVLAADTHSVVGTNARTTFIDGGASRGAGILPLRVPNGATASLFNVTVTNGIGGNRGGGIEVDSGGLLHLLNSRVTGNRANVGGGIFSEGSLAVTNSLIDHNAAGDGFGGGIATQLPASASFVDSPATIINSTISDNNTPTRSVPGGGIAAGGTLEIISSTIANNFGGGGGPDAIQYPTSPSAPVIIKNTILTGLPGSGNPVCSTTPLSFTTGHNIATDNSCGLTAATGDRPSTDPLIGALANNGGPTDTRALLANSPALAAADSNFCPGVDQRGIARPPGQCDIGAFQRTGAPPISPEIPAPTYGKTFNLPKWKGLVRYKLPGSTKYVRLTEGAQIPKGTTLDTSKGRVTLTSADKKGKQQHGWFYEGVFKIAGQTKGKKPITLLKLNGPKPQCGSSTANKSSAGTARKRRRSRHLWGSGRGRFRTTGQFSSATVRGTIWLTQDTCKGTLVKVKRGVVAVKDFTRHKTFLVKAGHSHLAPRRRP